MLEDAAGIRRVVLACGTVDLRKGSCGWEQDSCFYINALKQDGYPGQETYRKPQILPKNSTSIL